MMPKPGEPVPELEIDKHEKNKAPRIDFACPYCLGRDHVEFDASVRWNPDKQEYVITDVEGMCWCHAPDCPGDPIHGQAFERPIIIELD